MLMLRLCYIMAVLLVLACSCGSTPEHVLPPEKMARLLADVHIGESVIEANRGDYNNDSLKKELKQSIYLKHNVTAQQVDTSFDWYGHHIEDYVEIYDRVIEILEDDLADVKVAGGVQLAVAGDSADAWSGIRHYRLGKNMLSNYVSFAIERDENWHKGDVYEWRMKKISGHSPLDMFIAADYADGSSEYINVSRPKEGWQELSLYTDSNKTATRIYGVAQVELLDNERVYIDSISLVRTRLDADKYLRRYNQKRFNYGRKNAKK